ncbi:MAG: hypothetical protein JGK17_29895 [Microcoleus sp. PH2017_10_PVI_O_A]|uniref:hypothetical protein n=1 Tax=unclassified Microcoleus TaxID=2642155 RepID=UPI001D605D02|nr:MULTISPECIES: hypothetical protein [unclassified Microcoleus]MCC3409690.1 hypothetical protein [Microcoleus sp. PH2017_10_PVI_O_A]MCC3463955.1 hypothetical protein [Microcoleus sp. PH2017_11_PCY_U_A]MCC3482280.1 hypothetical protein [Microcoleus sp. PH2017_12_PCY_D_A]MCC3563260.1 hypothetical protein [Microcoleus sp. PH2017_27_LUM_O_A]
MSLTSDFLADFKTFMRLQAILIPSQIPARNGNFQFIAQGLHAALVQTAAAGTNIPGYYVHPVANNNNIYALPTQQKGTYYMITDGMNGCQFLAYGPDRQHITVEHNNFINDPANYDVRLKQIQQQNPKYLFHISAGSKDQIANGIYDRAHGINIVGEYTIINGWRFWVRDRVDQNQGQVYDPF